MTHSLKNKVNLLNDYNMRLILYLVLSAALVTTATAQEEVEAETEEQYEEYAVAADHQENR